jgi:ribosome biogenesis GTPase
VFDDFTFAAQECRFSNCAHGGEPGCAVRAAIDAGTLTPERFARWRALEAGEAATTARTSRRRPR